MMIIEHISTACASMKSHKMKTFLTLLGIIIGVSSVVTITTLGNTVDYLMNDVFQSSVGGDKMVAEVKASPNYSQSIFGSEIPTDAYIPEKAVEEFSQKYDKYVENEVFISTLENVSGYSDSIESAVSVDVYGISADYFGSQDIIEGRGITKADCTQNRSVIVIPDVVAEANYSGNAIGENYYVRTVDGQIITYVVVGICKYDEYTYMDYEFLTYPIYVPYTYQVSVLNIELDRSSYYVGWKFICDGDMVETVVKDAEEYFNSYYDDSGQWCVEVSTLSEYLKTFSDVVGILTAVISALSGFSLIIGGTGIMNVMLINVSERVNEIGIRKSLGAKNKDILNQFLVETVLISVLGGIFGVALGLLLSLLVCLALPQMFSTVSENFNVIMKPDYLVVTLSLIISAIIGILFGVYPANKAAKMKPVDALRK